MATTVGLISLGCSKNRVDSENALGFLRERGYQIVSDPAKAEVIIVNTCGFIQPAKEEAISTIFEMAEYKETGKCRLLVATGCFAQRYPEAIREEMPEVDVIMGVNEYEKLDKTLPFPYFPHVSVGWDNNPRFHNFRPGIVKNATPEEIEKALRMAKEFVDTHELPMPLITVNSWNEWTETSYLQPDNVYGYGYLEAVKEVFKNEK